MKPSVHRTSIFGLLTLSLLLLLTVSPDETLAFKPWNRGSGHPLFEATKGDQSHQNITETAIENFVANNPGIFGSARPGKSVLQQITDAVGKVDIWEPKTEDAHCDSEHIEGAQLRITGQKLPAIKASMDSNNVTQARTALGQALHTIQDFYSHSNWVELFPNPATAGINPDLGRPGRIVSTNEAVGDEQTCVDCDSSCSHNLVTSKLTSGYFGTYKPLFVGKCSHGGFLDFTSLVFAQGGINKDGSLSNHGYLHADAARVATAATEAFLANLTVDGGLSNDQVFKLLCGSSLAICIDTTGSMGDIIEAVKDEAIAIVESRKAGNDPPTQYVLEPFNDPEIGPITVTQDPDEFEDAISTLYASGGDDCPELAMSGIFSALSACQPFGTLFVFTDADAKDASLAPQVIDLATSRQIKIYDAIFGSCAFEAKAGRSHQRSSSAGSRTNSNVTRGSGKKILSSSHGTDPSYEQVANASGGQLFLAETSEAGSLTTLLDSVSRSNAVDLLSIDDSPVTTPVVYSVPIDDTMTSVTFSISGATDVTITDPDGTVVQDGVAGASVITLSDSILATIAGPASGSWSVTINNPDSISVRVSGQSDLDIKSFGFVEEGSDQAHEEGLYPISGFPIAGAVNIAAATLSGPFASARFESRTSSGQVLSNFALLPGSEESAASFDGDVTLSDDPFLFYVTGQTAGGFAFQRLAPGVIQPQAVTIDAPAPQTLRPGRTYSYSFTVKNLGPTDSFTFSGTDSLAYITSVSPNNLMLNSGDSKTITVALAVPTSANVGDSDTLTVQATGSSSHNFSVVQSPIVANSALLNISTRMQILTGDSVLIEGFIVTGTMPKKLILRALGPSLASAGLTGVLADPILELHKPDGTVVTNDNWKRSQQSEIESTGIPPTDDFESAIVATLEPGGYTAIAKGKSNTTGIGLVEVYDLDQTVDSSCGNVSTRGFVDTGDNVMIGGVIVGGGDGDVLVRAIGPSLKAQGVSNVLADPTLELHDPDGGLISSNDNWKDAQEAQITATGIAPSNDHEAAIRATLPAGAYTAIVRGKDGKTGVALVEAYNL